MTESREPHDLPPGRLDPRELGPHGMSPEAAQSRERPANSDAGGPSTAANPYADHAVTGANSYADKPSASERNPISLIVGIVFILVGAYLGLGGLGRIGDAIEAVTVHGWVAGSGLVLHVGVRLLIAMVFIGGGIGAVTGKLRSSD